MQNRSKTFLGILLLLSLLQPLEGCRPKKPSTEGAPSDADADALTSAKGLKVSSIRLFGAGGERPDNLFARGEQVTIRFIIQGLTSKERRIHLRTSLTLRGPGGPVHIRRPESSAIDRQVPAGKSTELVEAAVQLRLSPASPAGPYEAELRLFDAIGNKRAVAKVELRVPGVLGKPAKHLEIRRFRASSDSDLLAGMPLRLYFEPAGFETRRVAPPKGDPRWMVHLNVAAELRDGRGDLVTKKSALLLKEQLPFRPQSVPAAFQLRLPANLVPGSYHVWLTVTNELNRRSAKVLHRFKLMPGALGIYDLRLEGSGHVARQHFLRGERIVMKLHVRGWKPPANAGLDIGLVGPDKGFYLVRRNAFPITEGAGAKGRELAIPLTVPEFAPGGRWVVKLRLRDHSGKQHASRDVSFVVTGQPLRRLPHLQLSKLVMRRWQTGPPIPGLFLRANELIFLELIVGGMRLKQEQAYYYRTKLRCTLRLRDRHGKLKASVPNACYLDRRFSFAPLRLRLRAQWTIPKGLMGKHTLQVEVLDELSDRVSVLQRNAFILIPRGRR
ncbi:MAG: hypothetical protein ABI333_19050 [bacterium]